MADLIPDPLRAARLILQLRRQGITNDAVLSALETVDRGAFVDAKLAELANEDCSVPIACGQTIPRPLVTAQLLSALSISPGKEERILLVGSGSGYTAALLAHSARHVYGIERYKKLVGQSRERLSRLGVENVTIRHGDGLQGLSEHGPFDRILLCGAVTTIPRELLEQLSKDGILVTPLNESDTQVLRILNAERHVSDQPIANPLSALVAGKADHF
ncbi:protein-L-isoaspartate(D-aspartate) O-methyltransferase [Hyphomonas sp. FCG-A18]|uniref:protein-L-isoaspartate(D-aspartate) O-methyltransferase n=1 Tax=Hyphomonas sp. FCG-A18 TaxID=3080019 RepID=UPI002B3036A5|nr:protein-L-isoaspartate(D-aspartate) O-methyltransferase [Hyphomonas sp. FCG-A18]